MKWEWRSSSAIRKFVLALGASSLVSVILYMTRTNTTGSLYFGFLIWNLVLAWLPLIFAVLLTRRLRSSSWMAWQNLLLTLLWLGFLPNGFYLVSDFIHLSYATAIDPLFDIVMLTSFAFNGFVLGFASLFLVHRDLIKRSEWQFAHGLIASVLFACSFAIYLGRYLRWNTWDVLVKPAGLLFDVSDRLINPSAHGRTFTTTMLFFILLGTMYTVIWQLAAAVTDKHRR